MLNLTRYFVFAYFLAMCVNFKYSRNEHIKFRKNYKLTQ